jgi:hypothetical protein
MRRLVPIAAFALFLAVPLWAQHGGGHGGGGGGHAGGSGGHSSFSGGHGSGFSGSHMSGGGHVSSGMRSAPSAPYSRQFSRPSSRPFYPPQYQRGLNEEMLSQRSLNQRSLNQRAFSRPPFTRNRFRGNRFQTFGFRNRCFGFPCRSYYAYPWSYGAFYDPFWWGDSGSSSYDEDYDQDRAVAEDMNQQSLDEQQVRGQQIMQQEEGDGDQDLYARSSPRTAQRESEGAPILPNTVLVFRDQHKEEVRNYAIVGQTLWNFNPQHTEKISLADLDLAATAKANDDRGLTFRVPDSNQAQ